MYILQDFDNLLEQIKENGIRRSTRGVDTLSLPGTQSKYRIDNFFPIPTRRKAFYKSIFGELLWMISGSTNVNILREQYGSKIWDFWKDTEFEKRNGYEDGDLGPIYGFQFRHFGGDYAKRHTNPGGFDQIQYVVNELKTNKYSRRIMINLWDPNVMTTDKVKLPCCHFNINFFVDNQDRLTGILNQRSCDVPVGGFANIYFYSALIYMLAQQTDLKPYELVHNISDAHIYVDQLPALEEYFNRPEIPSPILNLKKAKDIFSYTIDDFVIENYNPAPAIKFPVTV